MASAERDRAAQRLEAALVEQDRLGERFDAVVGTSTEFGAYVRLRGAGDQVLARRSAQLGRRRGLPRGSTRALSNCSPRAAHSLVLEDWKVATMTSNRRHRASEGAARRRGGLHRADGDRRVGRAIKAGHDLATRGVGRAWLNGRESAVQIPATGTSTLRTTVQPAYAARGTAASRPAVADRSDRARRVITGRWRTTRSVHEASRR